MQALFAKSRVFCAAGLLDSSAAGAAAAVDEQKQPQQLHQRDGQGSNVGHRGGPEDFFRAAELIFIQKAVLLQGAQGPVAGVKLCGQCHQLEDGTQAKAGNACIGDADEQIAVGRKDKADQDQRHRQARADVCHWDDGAADLE